MPDLLHLAHLAGIDTRFRDAFGQEREVSDSTIRALLQSLGVDAADPGSVTALEDEGWASLLEPVHIVAEEDPAPELPVTLPEGASGRLEWQLVREDGSIARGTGETGEARVHRHGRVKRGFRLPAGLPLGYHQLQLTGAGEHGTTSLIVAPRRCHLPDALGDGRRTWAFTIQLHALRSARNWGIGDFGDLALLAEGTARSGAAAVGLNPLHALFPAEPRHISPYSPSSRRFLNPLYIDIAALPGFAEVEAPDRERIEAARQAELVDHAAVAALKRPVLEALFRRFRERGGNVEMDEVLARFALFEALQEHAIASGWGFSWRHWPEPYRHPESPEVRRFIDAHAERVRFFAWMQNEADRQLGEAARRARDAGMPIGLYRDLAVGVDPSGGEAWSDQRLLVPGPTIGAPPDPLALKGQNWGLVPLSPRALRRRAYAPFVAALRANMRHAGALRIDHVMALAHLFWIPEGAEASEGAYVDYPFEDLLRLLALESRRHRCMVVGEDLGTVPVGFRERMHEAGVLSYRVVSFERRHDGSFIPPREYPELASASVATHDLPTLRGWWLGRDIDWRERLDLYPDEASRAGDRGTRARDRRLLIDALLHEGVLEHDQAAAILPSAEQPVWLPELAEAVHRFAARSNAKLVLVQVEDAIGETEQANLPGTVDEHPNWRRKLSVGLEEMFGNDLFQRVTAAAGEGRG